MHSLSYAAAVKSEDSQSHALANVRVEYSRLPFTGRESFDSIQLWRCCGINTRIAAAGGSDCRQPLNIRDAGHRETEAFPRSDLTRSGSWKRAVILAQFFTDPRR